MSQANAKLCGKVSAVIFCLVWLTFSSRSVEAAQASNPASNGVISGRVTADQGEVRAFRVRARDTVHLILYTVFTNKGQYHIYNLPPSTYEVQVVENGFQSPAQNVELKAGETKTADVSLKAKPVTSQVKFVDYDALFPPGRGRDILELNCFGCHAVAAGVRDIGSYQGRAGRSESAWAAAVKTMFHVNDAFPSPTWTSMSAGSSKGYNPGNAITDQEKQIVVKYLADNFPADEEKRDLKLDTLVRDEDVLAQAMYVQYELPMVDKAEFPGLTLNRFTHDVWPSGDPSRRGTVWMGEAGASSILRVDTLSLDPKTRYKEWPMHDSRLNFNVAPTAVVERNGHLYWGENMSDNIGDLDISTGEIHRYLAPTTGQSMHGIGVDSKGNVWYNGFIGTVGRFDIETKKFTEWLPANGMGTFYTLQIDKKDRVFAASSARHILAMYDPKTDNWTTLKPPNNIRRLTVDSKGMVWMSEFGSNAVTMLNPDTQKFTEYKMPLKYGDPYSICVDGSDNIWSVNGAYASMTRFDQRTKKFTYFPFPTDGEFSPKVESADAEGTMWSGMSGREQPQYLTGFKPNGNVPSKNGNALMGKK